MGRPKRVQRASKHRGGNGRGQRQEAREPITFRQAVEQTPDLEGAWQPGLQALGNNSRRVAANDPRTIAGSVNVEVCLKTRRQTERQWDYAVGHKPMNRRTDVVYWIEVHPANDREINVMKEKLTSLLEWLRARAPRLNDLDGAFVWVSSGHTSFTKGAKQVRKLADEGLIFYGGVFRIPDEFVESGFA